MKKITYNDYYDKVYGCYLGVSIGGFLGAPFEGVKERINADIDFSSIDQMKFNDDLDLQVLFFQAVEKYGLDFNSNQLAKLFFENCPYAPGEYEFFKKNYERGILPSVSGAFNNEFYSEGMGCCIRGELWGCLFPNDIERAKQYAYYDGSLDHSNESVYSEYFVSSLISYAFTATDIDELIEKAKDQLPKESKLRKVIDTVVDWCESTKELDTVRNRIIWSFGHPDCTNVFQNIGLIVAGLKLYFDDFEKLIIETVRCGFDTDCTGGIVAAVWGTVNGGKAILQKYGIDEVKLVLGVDCNNYQGRVSCFAQAVASKGALFNDVRRSGLEITDAPSVQANFKNVVLYELLDYEPCIEFDRPKEITLKALLPKGVSGEFSYENSELEILYFSSEFCDNTCILKIKAMLPKREFTPASICGKLIFKASEGIDGDNCLPLGFAPPTTLEVFAPTFDTYYHAELSRGRYDRYFDIEKDENKRFDMLRNYHLSYKIPDVEDAYFLKDISMGKEAPIGKLEVYKDKLQPQDMIGFQGPCIVYLRRTVYFEEDTVCCLYCGCEGRVEIWLNGERVAENTSPAFFTYENLHINNVQFKKGENYLAFKILRHTGKESFSCNIMERFAISSKQRLDYKHKS